MSKWSTKRQALGDIHHVLHSNGMTAQANSSQVTKWNIDRRALGVTHTFCSWLLQVISNKIDTFSLNLILIIQYAEIMWHWIVAAALSRTCGRALHVWGHALRRQAEYRITTDIYMYNLKTWGQEMHFNRIGFFSWRVSQKVTCQWPNQILIVVVQSRLRTWCTGTLCSRTIECDMFELFNLLEEFRGTRDHREG